MTKFIGRIESHDVFIGNIESDEVDINVTVLGAGPRGEPGKDGEPFTYEDFTPEQLEELRVPVTELEEQVREADRAIYEAGLGVAHNVDPGRDLIEESDILYRTVHTIEDGQPWLRHVEVGKRLAGTVMTLTAPGTATRMRLYLKAQADTSGHLLLIGADPDDATNRFVLPVGTRTRHASAEFDLTAGRTVTINTAPMGSDPVRVWDVDWRAE